jgi:hypothetical protein
MKNKLYAEKEISYQFMQNNQNQKLTTGLSIL